MFRQIKDYLVLALHEAITVKHLVACPIVFILFYGQDWQGKLMKNDHFLVFLAVLIPFPQVFLAGQAVSYARIIRVTFSCVPNPYSFSL